jgi:hypothetical protein
MAAASRSIVRQERTVGSVDGGAERAAVGIMSLPRIGRGSGPEARSRLDSLRRC